MIVIDVEVMILHMAFSIPYSCDHQLCTHIKGNMIEIQLDTDSTTLSGDSALALVLIKAMIVNLYMKSGCMPSRYCEVRSPGLCY